MNNKYQILLEILLDFIVENLLRFDLGFIIENLLKFDLGFVVKDLLTFYFIARNFNRFVYFFINKDYK